MSEVLQEPGPGLPSGPSGTAPELGRSRAARGRARPGSAMLRTRAVVLAAALRCVERSGLRHLTMTEVAARAGVAKATLYNHFSTRDDVLAALVDSQVAALGECCAQVAGGRSEPEPDGGAPAAGLAAAVRTATDALAGARALRRLAADEPGALVRFLRPGDGPGWAAARAATSRVLGEAGAPDGPVAVDLVLRHLLSHLWWPSVGPDAAAGAARLERAVFALGAPGEGSQDPAGARGPAAARAVPGPAAGGPSRAAERSGLGWPA